MVMGPGSGGNSLGTAQGRIVIDVANVQQAAQLVKQAAADMTAAFNTINTQARLAAGGVQHLVTTSRQISQTVRTANNAAANASQQASRNAKQAATATSLSIRQVMTDLNRYDQAMTRVERRRGVRAGQDLYRGGAVAIDTRAIQRGEEVVNRAFASMQNRAVSFGQTLQRLGGQFFVFSVAAGVISTRAIASANALEALEIRFRALEGSQDAAAALMARLAEETRRFNLPLTETLAGIARLQPLLKTTGNETTRFVGLVARLASINPLQGAEGAAIAIGEALSGTGNDFYSLQERFNIPRNLIRAAIAETDNFADALDRVLNQLGATEQTAMEFGQTFQGTFRAALDALFRLLGEGLRPILNAITPLIQRAADFASALNDAGGPIPTILSGLLLATAAMAPLLYAVGKMAELWGTVGTRVMAVVRSQRTLSTLGRVGAAFLGAQAGLLVNQAITGESRQSAEERLSEFFAQSIALIIAGLEQLTANVGPGLEYVIGMIQTDLEALASILREGGARIGVVVGQIIEWLGNTIGDGTLAAQGGIIRSNLNTEVMREQTFRNADLAERRQDLVTAFQFARENAVNFAQRVQEIYNLLTGVTPVAGSAATATDEPQGFSTGFNAEQVQAFAQFKEDLAQLEQRYNDDVLRETQQFHQRRNDIILEYNERVVELQENEYRRRVEAEADLAREIAEVQQDSAEAQAKAQRDLQSEIAKILRESRIRVLEAAAQLDARAVFEEQRRTRARIAELGLEADEEAAERKRQADERVKDLQDEFAREEAKRAEAFQRQLADLERQKNRELQQLQQGHYNTLRELASQYQRERNLRQQQFITELNDLAQQNGRMLSIHRLGQFQIEYELLAWYNRMQSQLRAQTPTTSPTGVTVLGTSYGTNPYAQIPSGYYVPTAYQTGTSFVPDTTLYKLHKGEGVMTPEVNQIARRMLGGNYTQAQLARLMAGGGAGGHQSFDFSGMQIVLGDVGDRSDAQVSGMIEDALYQFFERAARKRSMMVA